MHLITTVLCLLGLFGAILTQDVLATSSSGYIEAGRFKLQYQIVGKARTQNDALATCAKIDSSPTWRLPTDAEFWGILMTGHVVFSTIPARDGKGYLGWVLPSNKHAITTHLPKMDDSYYYIEDGRGTQSQFISLSKTLDEIHEYLLKPLSPIEKQHLETIKNTLEEGLQVVCVQTD